MSAGRIEGRLLLVDDDESLLDLLAIDVRPAEWSAVLDLAVERIDQLVLVGDLRLAGRLVETISTTARTGAELVLLGTEWREYRDLDPAVLGDVVAGRHIVDARNALDPQRWRNAGWTYRALGRPTV